MATTTYGSPYVAGTDLVANWPAASLTVANSIDAAGYFIGRGINAQVASYTGVLTDAGKTVTMTVATANTFTVPANASVAYVIGTRIQIVNLGAGACTPTAGAGVTINGTITALATNGSAELLKTATNTWSYTPIGGGGKILQVVYASDASTSSSSSSTYADTGLTATITPSLATSKVLVLVQIAGTQKTANTARMNLKLLRGASDLVTFWLDGFDNGSAGINVGTQGTVYLDSPNTSTATTYKTQFSMQAGTAGIVYTESGATSTMILMEVAA